MNTPTVFRLLDCGTFNNSEELIDHLRANRYTFTMCSLVPFVDFEVSDEEFFEVKTILDDNQVDYRLFV